MSPTPTPKTASAATLFERGIAAHRAGKLDEAVALYEQGAAQGSSNPDLFNNLGVALMALRRLPEAATALRRALALKQKFGDALLNLGKVTEDMGDVAHAERLYRRAIEADPLLAPPRVNLGILLSHRNDFDGAIEQLKGAIAIKSSPRVAAIAHNHLGMVMRKLGRHQEAHENFHRALTLDPANRRARVALGVSLVAAQRFQEAAAHFEKVVEVDPKDAEAWSNLGITLGRLGQQVKGRACIERALAIEPGSALFLSNLLFALSFDPQVTPGEFLAAHKRWGEMHRAKMAPRRHAQTPDPDRRLCVGYVSADFHDHAAAYYLEPLIANHDRSAFEVLCFSANTLDDEVTDRIRASADQWIDIRRLTDVAAADKMRELGVDILVDCSSHTRGSRIAAFLHKPAPVQVGTLLGHAATTGIQEIDYMLSDPYITPDGFEDQFVEKLVRIPEFFAPFQPRASWPDEFPMASVESPVFGCVAHPSRISPELLAAWRKILDTVPRSSIIVKSKAFENPAELPYWRAFFGDLGDRIRFEGLVGGWSKGMDFYGRVHVILDSFPFTGSTSTLIPLWMGVPVVTWAGRLAPHRCSASALTCTGLPDLVTGSADEYAAQAIALVRDERRLRDLRVGLRETMRQAIYCDARRMTGQIEAAYRDMWRAWCAGQQKS